jgi:hypothetical protein
MAISGCRVDQRANASEQGFERRSPGFPARLPGAPGARGTGPDDEVAVADIILGDPLARVVADAEAALSRPTGLVKPSALSGVRKASPIPRR